MPWPQHDPKSIVRSGSLLDGKPGSVLGGNQQVGVSEGFKRVDEYIFIARFGSQEVTPSTSPILGSRPIDGVEKEAEDSEDDGVQRIGLDWQTARRRDLQSVRRTRPAQFYPIYVNEATGLIESYS